MFSPEQGFAGEVLVDGISVFLCQQEVFILNVCSLMSAQQQQNQTPQYRCLIVHHWLLVRGWDFPAVFQGNVSSMSSGALFLVEALAELHNTLRQGVRLLLRDSSSICTFTHSGATKNVVMDVPELCDKTAKYRINQRAVDCGQSLSGLRHVCAYVRSHRNRADMFSWWPCAHSVLGAIPWSWRCCS